MRSVTVFQRIVWKISFFIIASSFISARFHFDCIRTPPARARTQTGAVSFVNSRVGEFWYQLQLIGEKAPPTALPAMEAEVGRESTQIVVIENPSENEIEVRWAVLDGGAGMAFTMVIT